MPGIRTDSNLEILIRLDRDSVLTDQIYAQIRAAILDGRLGAGTRLPSSRDLAARIAVSRNTVVVAYERLHSEGFLVTKTGVGTMVCANVRPTANFRMNESPLRARQVWSDIPTYRDMSDEVKFDFRPGLPQANLSSLSRLSSRNVQGGSGAYIGAAGHPSLRAAIARHIGTARAVRATADDVFVTNGSQQAIDLIIRILLELGDRVAVEDPGYTLPRYAFQAYGCEVVGVPVDSEGLVVDAIPDDVKLVYVTPSHQFPLGMVMPLARRLQLLEWARRADAVIIEDDYDSEFRFDGRPLESLHGLDAGQRVLYVGSFSKTLMPSLRLGFCVLPPPLHQAFARARTITDWHSAVPIQLAVASFLEDGHFARHLRKMRRVYAERHACIAGILDRDFASDLNLLPSNCGLHIATIFNDQHASSDLEIAQQAESAGIALLPLSRMYLPGGEVQGLVFGYGRIDKSRISTGLSKLRDVVCHN